MKLKRTLIAVLAIVLVFGAFALFDTVRAQTYTIEVVSLTPEKPVADVRQQVQIKLRVTKKGKGVEGHSLFAISKNGGTFKGNRAETDEEGVASFIYIPFSATSLQPARPVTISVIDESNSVFLEINTRFEFVIDLQLKPKTTGGAL